MTSNFFQSFQVQALQLLVFFFFSCPSHSKSPTPTALSPLEYISLNNALHHKVPWSAMKNPPSFFFLLLSLWALQQTAATSNITTPTHSSATDTTLVWSNVLKVNVTPVPAMPITRDITPNGNTQRYQDFSVPPVAWASLSSVGRDSGGLAEHLPTLPSISPPSPQPFKPWFSESWCKLLASLLLPQSRSGWRTEAGGWRPEEQPISELPSLSDEARKAARRQRGSSLSTFDDCCRLWCYRGFLWSCFECYQWQRGCCYWSCCCWSQSLTPACACNWRHREKTWK